MSHAYEQTSAQMFYWFKRGEQLIQYESREVSPTRFELRITGRDGIESTECFDDSDSLHRRQVQFERELAAHGWAGPHGWNL